MTDLVFDANSLYARSWFAAQRISPDPKEALRLALNTILLLLNPDTNKIGSIFDRTLFAWDNNQNKEKQRDPKPAVYHETKAVLKDILEYVFGTVNIDHPEAEGDDIVATVVYNTKPSDLIYIVSGDKDLMQLQGRNCQYYSLNDKAVLSTSFIIHKFPNIKRPSQIALALAIVGDPVDNINGIDGYGEVRCKKLFEAVTPDMAFQQAMDAIVAQLPEKQATQFYEALNRTLLKTDVPGIPRPAPLNLLPPSEVEALGIPQIGFYYRQVHHTYTVEPY
jgi:5'-3' exonuclease